MEDIIDRINLATMSSPQVVEAYSGPEDDVMAHERLALESIANEVRGQPILDIGVGGGRTTRALLQLSTDYLGVDYSEAMVAQCRRRYPGVRFEHSDARQLAGVADNSIALAVFSCNGISMVGHDDRLLILRQVRRVLRPNGYFVFTTYNLDSPEATAGFRFPEIRWSANPARSAIRGMRWVRDTVTGLRNRRRFTPHEIRTPGYAVINDRCHNYGVMLYYIGLEDQRRQLVNEGFESDAPAFECTGRRITDGTRLDSMLFVARKSS